MPKTKQKQLSIEVKTYIRVYETVDYTENNLIEVKISHFATTTKREVLAGLINDISRLTSREAITQMEELEEKLSVEERTQQAEKGPTPDAFIESV